MLLALLNRLLQCYGTSFLAVHAIVEPIRDWSVQIFARWRHHPLSDALHMYRLCQCGIGSFIPGFRVASEASLAAVWIYTRCYMHYMVLMAPMIARVPYDSAVLLAIHVLMWAMFLLQLYWGGDVRAATCLRALVIDCRYHGAKSGAQVRVGQEGCHQAAK